MKRPLPSLEESLRILRTTHTKRAPKNAPAVQKQVQPLLKSLQARFEASDDGSAMLKNRWSEIVGESLGKVCEPVRIIKGRTTAVNPKGGTLEIRVAGSYAALIQHQSSVLLDRINLFLGGRAIERLQLIQGPLTLPQKMPPHAPPRPLSPQEELGLRQALDDVDDPKLQKSLLLLGRAVIQRNRKP